VITIIATDNNRYNTACVKLCECGCGRPTRLATRTCRASNKGAPLRFIIGHQRRGSINSLTSNELRSRKLRGRHRHPWEVEAAREGIRKSWKRSETVAKHIRAVTGRDPVYSPYISGLVVSKQKGRWYCVDPKGKSGGRYRYTTHARIVYEHYYGLVPVGCDVHHRNGRYADLSDDRPDNLTAVPVIWNQRYLPILARGFNIPEAEATAAYLQLVDCTPAGELFPAVCKFLLETNTMILNQPLDNLVAIE